MTIELISQIDISHWTVRFLDGQWQGKLGDYRIETPMNSGAILEVDVQHYPKHTEPSMNGYCGKMVVRGVKKPK